MYHEHWYSFTIEVIVIPKKCQKIIKTDICKTDRADSRSLDISREKILRIEIFCLHCREILSFWQTADRQFGVTAWCKVHANWPDWLRAGVETHLLLFTPPSSFLAVFTALSNTHWEWSFQVWRLVTKVFSFGGRTYIACIIKWAMDVSATMKEFYTSNKNALTFPC